MAEKSKGGAKTKSGGGGKSADCWKGYERVPGKKAGAEGSCRKKGSAKGK